MKERIRSVLEWVTELKNISSPVIVLPRFNRTLVPIIKSVYKSGFRILFQLMVKKEYDDLYIDIYDVKFKKRFNRFVEIYKNYFSKFDIQYFVVDRLNKKDLCAMASLEAAKQLRVNTVYLEHGHSGCYHPNVMAGWLLNFDYIYVQDDSMKRYLFLERQKLNMVSIIQGWKERELKKWNKKNNKILYAPTTLSYMDRFGRLMPETLRYQFQKEIIKVLSKYNRQIIYSTYSRGNEQFDPMPDYIQTYFPWIKVIDGKNLTNVMRKVALFITDAVSTPLYHAAEMGVPSLCLEYSRAVKTREDVRELWGDALLKFDSKDDLVLLLEHFMDNKNLWKPLPLIPCKIDKFPWEKINEKN